MHKTSIFSDLPQTCRDFEIKINLNVARKCFGLCPVTDSSSDYSQRTGFDIPSLQQELRTTPEGARRDPDDPLPDRIKVNPAFILRSSIIDVNQSCIMSRWSFIQPPNETA